MQRLRYSRYFKSIIIAIDIVIVALVFLFFFWKREDFIFRNFLTDNSVIILLIIIFYWILLSGTTKIYSIQRNITYTEYLQRLLSHIIIFITGVILLAQVVDNEHLKGDRIFLSFLLVSILFFIKSFIFFLIKSYRSLGKNHRNIMFFGDNSSIALIKEVVEKRKDYGYKIFIPNIDILKNIDAIKSYWDEHGIHSIFIPTEENLDPDFERDLFIAAEEAKIRIILIPSLIHNQYLSYQISYIESLPILSPIKYPLDYYTNFVLKRTLDLFISILILVGICSWLFPIIAIILWLDNKGPIFFKQKRYGYHEEVFECLKFRTMKVNDESTSKTTSENDDRITRFGRLLRKSSLDELPQFINVFLGDMSIVGPRPHMILIDDYYKPKIGRYAVRSLVKPGITGLAQVNGLRGDVGDMNIQMKKRYVADSYYVRNWSLSLDFVIILKTIILLIQGDKNAR